MIKNIKKTVSLILASALFTLCVSGCIPSFVTTSAADGIWYEQDEYGGIITIDKNVMTYERDDFSTSTTFSPSNTDDGIELVPEEEYWVFIDIFYNAYEDTLTMHTMPHTDGDGGYHLVTFLRTKYVAPPEPVYGERIDNSDPGALKELDDYTVKTLSLSVYEPLRDNGDMAQELPDMGSYSYELTVNDDGSGELSSDFCRTIPVSSSALSGLSDIIRDSGLMNINGTDIITEDMPEDTVGYELNIEFASGDTYHSRANGKDVPMEWETGGRELHKYLFDLFIEAGYYPYSGEFHSTGAIKRIGPRRGAPCRYSVSAEEKRIDKESSAYDYTLYSKYPEFSVEGDAPAALVRTLDELSEHFKELAGKDIAEEYEIMEAVPESIWKNNEHRSTYSFYSPIHENADDTKYYFWIDEGHSNCFDLGEHGSGDYSYMRYCIDAESGDLMSLSDFFTDDEVLAERITTLIEEYNDAEDRNAYLHSEEYQQKLLAGLTAPESEGGIGFEPADDGINLYMDENSDDVLFYPYDMKLFYEDVQDILNDKYSTVREIRG